MRTLKKLMTVIRNKIKRARARELKRQREQLASVFARAARPRR